jgi:translin
MMTAYQEYTEAKQLISLLKNDIFLTPEELGVPYKSYLSGIGDLVGELRRYGLNAIRQENIENAERVLDLMEEIYESLSSVEYPKSLVPGLRLKCDIARALLERTRGDVMNAIQRKKLIKEMRGLTQELKRHSQKPHD